MANIAVDDSAVIIDRDPVTWETFGSLDEGGESSVGQLWPRGGSAPGSTGATGATGPAGPTGPTGPAGSRYPDTKPGTEELPSSANAMDDEFSDASGHSGPLNGLAAKWSKHNIGTASWLILDDAQAPGSLLFAIPASNPADQGIYQPVPAGDFRAVARFEAAHMGDRQMWGLFIVSTAGAGVSMTGDDTADVARLRNLTAWVQTSSVAPGAYTAGYGYVAGVPITLSLRKSGTTYFGSLWHGERVKPSAMIEISGTPTAFTPAYVGFGRVHGGGSLGTSRIALDYFRISA